MITERAIASILEQTYANFEVIVVGDCCTDLTEGLIKEIADSRIKFVNLNKRGSYPKERYRRWLVAGAIPYNHALDLANGDLITHLDDDDEYYPDRLEKLVGHMQKNKLELVYHPFNFQDSDGKWKINKADPLEDGFNYIFKHNVTYHFSKKLDRMCIAIYICILAIGIGYQR